MPEKKTPIEKLEKIVVNDLPDVFEEIQKDETISRAKRIKCSAPLKNALDQLQGAVTILKE